MNRISSRPLALGTLRAFEAVARRLSFSAAAEELHLTQPAISRQIRTLEDELGATLFLRGTRRVQLTGAGEMLQRAVAPMLDRLDATVRQLRSARGRRQVAVTTFASFASMWLLPRLHDFQQRHPDIDIRISAQDQLADADDPELDFALRCCRADQAPAGSDALFGEVLTPLASPALLARGAPLAQPADLARHTLIEENDPRPSADYTSWPRWLALHAPAGLQPRGWVYLNFADQKVQVALAGQGITLARLALAADVLARGDLVEPFGPARRLGSPYAYWLVRWPGSRERPEARAFAEWVLEQAAATRAQLASL